MTPECFEVEYHQVPDIRTLDRLPDCDLAAISTFTAQVKDAYALADRYRSGRQNGDRRSPPPPRCRRKRSSTAMRWWSARPN